MFRNLFELLECQTAKHRLLYQIDDVGHTIDDVIKGSKKTAAILACQINPKTKVLLIADDSINWIHAFWALHLLGAEIFILHHKVAGPQITRLKQIYGISIIITDNPELLLSDHSININQVHVEVNHDDHCYQYAPSDIIMHLSSSGTTGAADPKFIPHTLQNWYEYQGCLLDLCDLCEIDSGSTIICLAKLSFGWGFQTQILLPLLRGTKNIMSTKMPMPKNLHDFCEANHVTNLIVGPQILQIFVKSSRSLLSLLRSVTVGGETLTAAVAESYFEKYPDTPLINAYGTSETLTVTAGKVNRGQQITIGRPLTGVLLKIIDDNGQPVSKNQSGTLWIKTRHQISAYADDSNQECFRDGWFCSNDIAKIADDYNIFYLGRINSCMKKKGKWISLLDIENAILELSGVSDCTMIYANLQDQDVVYAMIVADNIPSYTIIGALKQRFKSRYMIPDKIVFVEKIPRTNNMKKIRNLNAFKPYTT